MNRYRHLVLLALLTFLLVITVLPATADFSSKYSSKYSSKFQIHTKVLSQKTPSGQLPRLQNSQNTIANSSVALLEQGKQLYDEGQFARAAQTWEKALKELEQLGERYNQALCYNYLAIVYQDLGKWKAAQNAISQSLLILDRLEPTSRPLQTGKMPSTHFVLLLAQLLNTQGSLQLNTNRPEAA